MSNRLKFIASFIIWILLFSVYTFAENLDISGNWHYRLLGAPSSIPGEGSIMMPNTLDNAHKSIYTPKTDNTDQLRHEFSFIGEAIYSKEINIPEDWEGKEISLFLERTKPTRLRIDGKETGINSRISSPQIYDLTEFLLPGKHTFEIIVNNADSIPPIVARSSHAVSESTQTNWNGILGDMLLRAEDKFRIKSVRLDDSDLEKGVVIYVRFSSPASESGNTVELEWKSEKYMKEVPENAEWVEFSIPVDKDDLWSHRNPKLHPLNFRLFGPKGSHRQNYKITAGFRNFSQNGENFTINGHPVFLRGTVNAAVFPLTAYAPLDYKSWEDYFSTLQQYGLNHVRFHSWTPPEAAFEAADKLGFYIMVELPIWGELDRDLIFHNRFLKEELAGIMEAYANHPSFVMFSPGNELWGDISLMGDYMKAARTVNPRILSTYGSNVYLGMNGQLGEEDFMVSAKTKDDVSGHVRGSFSFADAPSGGHFNSQYPSNNSDFREATKNLTVPLISHEVGQYQSYPDFSEIQKYKGSLKPDNLEEFSKRAHEAGTLRKNTQFAEASGKWAAKLYKAEMEMATRTPGLGGYQLFGIQDYPGQGTAPVGILDPFMESKGFISPKEWRQSSSDLMIIAELPRFTFETGEKAEIPVMLVNYTGNPDEISKIKWSTPFTSGELITPAGSGLLDAGMIELEMVSLKSPEMMSLILETEDGKAENKYDFWIYPKEMKKVAKVVVTQNIDEALHSLKEGGRVILMPDSASIASASIDPLFTTDFWNYRMYRTICEEMHQKPSPGTLGLFIDKNHPSLSKFPTENHTDWQWFALISNSRPLIIDRLPKNFDPIVEVIDNVERNFRLALMLECNVGKGKLMIVSVDPEKAGNYPEGRWFIQSLKEYMAGKNCKPTITLTPEQVVNLLTKPSNARLIKELKNETFKGFL